MRHLLFIIAFFLPACIFSQQKGALRINEVMANPNGLLELPQTEYVELYNSSDQPVDLAGWQFCYGDRAVFLKPLILPADGYLLLYRSGRDIYQESAAHLMPLDNFPSALSNSGKSLSIISVDGEIVDHISYGKAKPAISWERDGDRFRLSVDSRGGTPGAPNSTINLEPERPQEHHDSVKPVAPEKPQLPASDLIDGDVVFNELLPNPFPDASEYIELYNRTDREIPLSALAISTRKVDGSLGRIYSFKSSGMSIKPAGYILLTKCVDGVRDYYLSASIDVMCELSLPALANTSATLVLLNELDSSVIDEVSYSSEWHSPMIKDQRGVALERIDPNGESQDRHNWASASVFDGFGTPGYKNSQHDNLNPEATTSIEAPQYSDMDNEYIIRYHTDMAGYTCRAWVYNTVGKRLVEISNIALLGSEGELKWSGFDSNGSRLKSGVYIFYAELVHPEGSVKRVKEVFLVK